jgi:hypothetical protein
MSDVRPIGHQQRQGLRCVVRALVVVLAIVNAAQGRVEVHVAHVGFPRIQGGDVIRSGVWVPIIVDLALAEQPSFDGSVRAAQADDDGDECFDTVEVHIRSETGGTQRVYLYVPANPLRGQGRSYVEVRNAEGEAVKVVTQGELSYRAEPAEPPTVIAADDLLVLSISSSTVGRVSELLSSEKRSLFTRDVQIAHMSPTDLPELWIGLEGVDYIVWDDARPEELTQRQLEALLEWVRQGGTLLMAASQTAGSLRLTKLIEPVLPVDIGPLAAVDRLPDVRRTLLDPPAGAEEVRRTVTGWEGDPFPSPIPVVRCTRRADSIVVARENGIPSDLVARRRLGRGHVVFVGVTLRDLFSAPGGVAKFFATTFHLTPLSKSDDPRATPVSLFGRVVSAIAFSTSGSVYLLTAGAFSVLYVLAATFGTWRFLRAKAMVHHSWTAFAMVGFAASALSVVVVGSMRGFGDRLHQIAIIDADGGQTRGFGTAFFGLKTSLDAEVDLWLAPDWIGAGEPTETSCFLRAIPEGTDPLEGVSSFADPEEYRVVPGSAVIDGVRIRATLKRFEGRWEGPLAGKLTGQIQVRGGRITEDSFVVNQLGVHLRDCYLLHPVLNLGDIAGTRDQSMYAYFIGDVPSDGTKVPLAERCYRSATGEALRDLMLGSKLAKRQEEWSKPFRGLLATMGYKSDGEGAAAMGQEQKALLLLSTVGEFDPKTISTRMGDLLGGVQTWSRDRLRQLDLREQLQAGRVATEDRPDEPGSVVLIGFTSDPGPIRLFARTGDRAFKPIPPEASASWSMYRIRLPLTRLDMVDESAEPRKPEEPVYDEKLPRGGRP